MLDVVAQCATTCNGFMVTLPLPVDQDLGVVAQTPVHPHDAVADLEPGVLDGAREPVVGPRPAEREQVRPRLHAVTDQLPELGAGHAVVPLLPHESALAAACLAVPEQPATLPWPPGQAVWRIRHHSVEQAKPGQHPPAVPEVDGPAVPLV